MPVQVWTVGEFLDKAREQQGPEPVTNDAGVSWLDSVKALGQRAHARGDGVAVYVNQDLGHPDIGQWQVMSYGSEASQLETRKVDTLSPENRKAYVRGTYAHGDDLIPTTLPDIGGRINWRYTLEAVVPSYEQDAKANEFGTPGYSATPPAEPEWIEPTDLWKHLQEQHHTDTTGLDDSDVERWQERHREKLHRAGRPQRVEHNHNRPPSERLVVVQVKVTGGATEEEALAVVKQACWAGLANWQDSGGEVGFLPEEPIGPDAYDKGVRVELIDSAVI